MERNILIENIIIANEILIKNISNLDIMNSESESENEMDELFYITQVSRLRGKRRKKVRIEGYVDNIVPRFTTHQFKEHFRMTHCFYLLKNKISLILLNRNKTGRPIISPRVQLLATLWLLATSDSYRYKCYNVHTCK